MPIITKIRLKNSTIGKECKVGDGAHAKIQRQSDGVLYVTSKNLKNGKLDLSKVDFISKSDYDKYFKDSSNALTKPLEDDIIFSIIGTMGEPYLVKKSDIFGLSSSVAILRPDNKNIYPQYLYYWIRGPIFQSAIWGIKGGVAQSYVSLEMIKSLPIIYPSIACQKKIASILSTYDDLIENNTRRIQILEEMAQNIYKEWFVNFRFPGHENVKIVDHPEWGIIPEGWELVKICDVMELAYGKALVAKNRVEGSNLVYGSSGIVGTHDEYLVKAPGIIVGRKGNVGTVFWTNVNFYPIDTVYYVKTDYSLPYIYYNLKHQNFISGDAAVPGLNRNYSYSLPFIKPSSVLLKSFENQINPIFKQLQILEDKNKILTQTRDLLLPKIISGEIDVEDLDIEVKDDA